MKVGHDWQHRADGHAPGRFCNNSLSQRKRQWFWDTMSRTSIDLEIEDVLRWVHGDRP